jgi:malonyl-CoA/methylmalonyl-CoA synthetase
MMHDELEIVRRAESFGARTALIDALGSTSYDDLLARSARLAGGLLGDRTDLAEERVVALVPAGADFAITQWAIWRAGGIVVPVTGAQAPREWAYVVADSRASAAVVHPSFEAFMPVARDAGLRVVLSGGGADPGRALPSVPADRRAMILYTSGTTSAPKGAVLTHANVEAEIGCLIDAWGWNADDRILHVLPLNHTHGLINVLGCALWSGAVCEMLPRPDADRVWDRLAGGGLSLFMAVPTIYRRLVAAWEAADEGCRQRWSAGAARLRLMVSGSAALPVALLESWRTITGHVLLERYGMTEIGMALSNPLIGERRPGTVGTPLPRVEVRLCDESGAEGPEGQPGEILVKGPGVFLEYWGRPEETAGAFLDGWFRTGDVAVVERGRYRILGRRSVDIIKTGGYKVSALEIEETLREHPAVADCAIVGIEDTEWGERVSAAIVLRPGGTPAAGELVAWARERMAGYKVPRRILFVSDLPRNAMGKVSKPDVKRLFEPESG